MKDDVRLWDMICAASNRLTAPISKPITKSWMLEMSEKMHRYRFNLSNCLLEMLLIILSQNIGCDRESIGKTKYLCSRNLTNTSEVNTNHDIYDSL